MSPKTVKAQSVQKRFSFMMNNTGDKNDKLLTIQKIDFMQNRDKPERMNDDEE